MIKIKWSKDGKVCFEPVTHTYWMGRKNLMGITTHISKHKEFFDDIGKVSQMSETPWELLRQWREKGNTSRDNGTKAHTVFETYFETGNTVISDGKKDHVAAKFIEDYFVSGKMTFVECESLVYGDTLASMRDAVVCNQFGKYFILDWKTNDEIKTNNYGRFLLPPYQNIPAASFYEYSLQARLYQKMSVDYAIEDCFIVHLKDNSYEFIKAANIKI